MERFLIQIRTQSRVLVPAGLVSFAIVSVGLSCTSSVDRFPTTVSASTMLINERTTYILYLITCNF